MGPANGNRQRIRLPRRLADYRYLEHDSGRLAWRGIYRDSLRNRPDLGDEKTRDIVNRTLKGLEL